MDIDFPRPPGAPGVAAEPVRPAWRRIPVTPLTIVLAIAVGAVVLGGGLLGVAKATDSPAFCGSACHEMAPYHAAWTRGAHKDVACVECHVDPGLGAEISHKVVALRQLVDHVKGAPTFPLAAAPDIPDSRCIRCHSHVTANIAGFSHDDHASRAPCVKCHPDAGHNVTNSALQNAGVYNVAYRPASALATQTVIGGGKADIPNHVAVSCSNCHDMAGMRCADCHTASRTHQDRSAQCTICHSAGPAWVFTHPALTTCGDCHTTPSDHTWPTNPCTTCHTAGPGKSFAFTHPQDTGCEACHARPSDHGASRSAACSTCHHSPGQSWSFSHPSSSATCTDCHASPSGHAGRTVCVDCHETGVTWAFNHPGIGASCEQCHTRPGNHSSGPCQNCHKNPGKSWSFSHPGKGADCASCHARPSDHGANRSATCANCHTNPGRSWAFSHPLSTACASCHTPPSNHFGTACASCHVAGTTWSNVHFSHPATPAPHGVAGKACSACHPNGAPAYFCTCHGNTTGPSD